MTSWVPRGLLIHPPYFHSHRIHSLLAHLSSSQYIQVCPSPPIFSLFSCPLTSWVHDLWVEGPVGWRFNLAFWGIPLALTSWIKIITRGIYWMVIHLYRTIHSSYVPFTLYKPNSLPLISLLLLKSTFRVHLSSLSDNHTVQLLHPSSTPLYRSTSTWWAFFSFYLKNFYALFISLDFVLLSSIIDPSKS